MAHDIYDLDGSANKVKILREFADIRLEIDTLKELLDHHGIIPSLEFEAAKKYRASLPQYQALMEGLDRAEAQINHYKSDPQAHLRDIFNAKLHGQL